MSYLPNGQRLGTDSLIVRQSIVASGSAEFKGHVKFGPAAEITIQGPLKLDNIKEATENAGVTVDGVLLKDNDVCVDDVTCVNVRAKSEENGVCFPDNLAVDYVREKTASHGVDVDGVLLKDGVVYTDLILAQTDAGR